VAALLGDLRTDTQITHDSGRSAAFRRVASLGAKDVAFRATCSDGGDRVRACGTVALRSPLHGENRCVLRTDKAVVLYDVPVELDSDTVRQQPANRQAGGLQRDEGADGM
jgi:hypothetical protein